MSRPKDLNAPSRWNMRIWDDDKKEWLCQNDRDALTYYGFDITGGEMTEFQGLPKWHPDRHLIWEQSTGLKDKNSKEIYEGDIVRVRTVSEESDIGVLVAPIVWYKYKYCLGRPTAAASNGWTLRYESELMEVIGNIHENPELLGGEDEQSKS